MTRSPTIVQKLIDVGSFCISYSIDFDMILYHEVVEPIDDYKPHMDDVRFVRTFSKICPDGEYGSFHIANALAILTESQFSMMRQCGWPRFDCRMPRNFNDDESNSLISN